MTLNVCASAAGVSMAVNTRTVIHVAAASVKLVARRLCLRFRFGIVILSNTRRRLAFSLLTDGLGDITKARWPIGVAGLCDEPSGNAMQIWPNCVNFLVSQFRT